METSKIQQENVGDISNLNQNLTELYLSYNQLTSLVLPDNPLSMSNLVELHLSHNHLNSLPDNIGCFSNLRNLYLSYNQLTSLPESIGNLSNLIKLDVSSNQLTARLTHLYVNAGRQNDGHDETFNLLKMSVTSFRKLIDIDLHGLITLPDTIGNLDNLTHLDVADNQLVTLPSSVSSLSNLICLNVSNNQIANLPDGVTKLSSLSRLNLSCNQLIDLSESIGNLSELLHLNISHNHLTDLPESITSLSKLMSLDVSSNSLIRIPESIGNLSSLTHLYLGFNNLISLPDSIKNLSNLKYLCLGDQLTNFPEHVENVADVSYLNSYNNPPIDLSILQSLPSLETVRFMNFDLPRQYWTKLSEWQPKWLLTEVNTEIRHRLIELLGYEKICDDLKAVTLDTWQEYTLLKIDGVEKIYDLNDKPIREEPIILLKMTCPSTQHIHILRVPPEIVSAEAAITWINHGIHPDRFAMQT
jgi:leucine-rich repeat protein SHOC2